MEQCCLEWENHLVSAVNGTQRLEFAYDYMDAGFSRRVIPGETLTKYLKFVYDGYKLAEEFDGLNSDALYHHYVWQPDSVRLDVPVSMYDTATDKTYFYHADANKNVTEMTDNLGALAAHYEYSPFGIQTVATGAFANENPFRFSSEYYDTETGLVYYNYRYYSPQLGRWIKKDSIGEEGGGNLFIFVDNSPLDLFDKLGLFPGIGRWYGNWAGKGYSGGLTDAERGNKPIDWTVPGICPLDECAKKHDACYVKCEKGKDPLTCEVKLKTQSQYNCKKDCDKQLVSCAKALFDSNDILFDYPKAKATRRKIVYQAIIGYYDK
ncbi:MAG: putative deoxyribonuclease RhsC [Lentisphaerae bacterium ADurb.Bin242]|nr:MAG: putative deoxyribonuclease RhsC [Lentisphaerae bacterium ADurb.Bin242]